MKREEIEHLANLARIKLTEEEISGFGEEIGEILEYVSVIKNLTVEANSTPTLSPRFNVFRPDQITNEPGSYTDDLLKAMPQTKGKHMLVKKILSHD